MADKFGNIVVGRGRVCFRAFLPIIIWGFVCLLPFIARISLETHRRKVASTKITFRLLLEGKELSSKPVIMLDGVIFEPHHHPEPGKHELKITAPSVEPYQKTVTIHYGENGLGEINLVRSTGTLFVRAIPKPRVLRIDSELFHDTMTTEEKRFGPIPVGRYKVIADFGLFSEERVAQVLRNDEVQVEINPLVGAFELASLPTNANYRLSSLTRTGIVLEGITPAGIETLPVGEYQLNTWREDYSKQSRLTITKGETNRLVVEFAYAAADFKTTPAGARVFSGTKLLGQTPFATQELKLGRHHFRIEVEGYVPAEFVAEAATNAFLSVETNLVSMRYGPAMERALQKMNRQAPDFRGALANVEDALKSMPGDAEATALKAKVELAMKAQAEKQADEKRRRDLAAAAQQEQAEHRADEKRRVAAEENHKRFTRDAFQKACAQVKDAELFDAQLWTARSTAESVAEALRRLLRIEGSGWKLDEETKLNEETVLFRCSAPQKFLSNTKRNAIVVIGQTTSEEVQVYGKFWDYISTKVELSLTQGLSKEGLVPVHPRYFGSERSAWVAARRKSVPEEFKTKLFNEIK